MLPLPGLPNGHDDRRQRSSLTTRSRTRVDGSPTTTKAKSKDEIRVMVSAQHLQAELGFTCWPYDSQPVSGTTEVPTVHSSAQVRSRGHVDVPSHPIIQITLDFGLLR